MRGGSWASVEIFPDKGGGGVIFRDFVRTSFMDGPKFITIAETAAYASKNRVSISDKKCFKHMKRSQLG